MKKNKITIIDDKEIIKAIKSALKGELFDSLRGVTASWNNEKMYLIAYVNGEITDSIVEHMDDIETYFLSHMPENYKTHFDIERVDIPQQIRCLREWIYIAKNERYV